MKRPFVIDDDCHILPIPCAIEKSQRPSLRRSNACGDFSEAFPHLVSTPESGQPESGHRRDALDRNITDSMATTMPSQAPASLSSCGSSILSTSTLSLLVGYCSQTTDSPIVGEASLPDSQLVECSQVTIADENWPADQSLLPDAQPVECSQIPIACEQLPADESQPGSLTWERPPVEEVPHPPTDCHGAYLAKWFLESQNVEQGQHSSAKAPEDCEDDSTALYSPT